MLFLILISVLSASFFYVESVKWGMNPKYWAMVALMIGPFVLPLFGIARHIHWRRAVGFNNLRIDA
ncbi:hypothetical protein Q4561_08405 [Alteromonas sp. 1_MG-2023]|uniref:hypothetical protein n=1 Tax=Alteromonas sp. 1_MG-2023 TaxID=3062669 RepID=UPI0026E436CA|nr:hypothetical protein [Alteromonas sp. 1_MG-2023]MDO6567079.1 hypothetical protein [Alteromonas sp. 1_MG-2023]